MLMKFHIHNDLLTKRCVLNKILFQVTSKLVILNILDDHLHGPLNIAKLVLDHYCYVEKLGELGLDLELWLSGYIR